MVCGNVVIFLFNGNEQYSLHKSLDGLVMCMLVTNSWCVP